MNHSAPLTQLGNFVLTFQAVEAAMVELTVQLVDADTEYVSTLAAELEFNSKARALDVIYTRYAQIHRLSQESPHPEFHNLMSRIQKLATRRNDLVHSFEHLAKLKITVVARVFASPRGEISVLFKPFSAFYPSRIIVLPSSVKWLPGVGLRQRYSRRLQPVGLDAAT